MGDIPMNKCLNPVMSRGLVLILFALVDIYSGAVAGESPYATTIIINGKVITADSDDIDEISFSEAIAIRDDEIIAVGSNNEVQSLVADWTEVIDAGGRTVLPGLIDTHNHLYDRMYIVFYPRCRLINAIAFERAS